MIYRVSMLQSCATIAPELNLILGGFYSGNTDIGTVCLFIKIRVARLYLNPIGNPGVHAI